MTTACTLSLPGAEVMFQPLEGNEAAETATGKANDDGVYRLTSVRGAPGKGTTVGEYGVAVTLFVRRKLGIVLKHMLEIPALSLESLFF
jgi:hypothetical protein